MNVYLRAILVALLVGPAPVGAQTAGADERTSTITHELMSPFCPELLLADCPSDSARVLREAIARRVGAGETARSIEDDLVGRYGDQIRTMPLFQGIGVLVWLAPPIAGALGLLAVAIAVCAATGRIATRHDEPENALEDDALREKLRYELEDLD